MSLKGLDLLTGKNELKRLPQSFLSLKQRLQKDPSLAHRLRMRGALLHLLREGFYKDGFLEVETPSLCFTGDPAVHLDSFTSDFHWKSKSTRLWLPTSPEHHMKRMVAAGMGSVFQICRFYRNGELGKHHQPEFTGLEWYEVGAGIQDTIDRTERLLRDTAIALLGKPLVNRGEKSIDLQKPFIRMTLRQALEEFAGVRTSRDWDLGELRESFEKAKLYPSESDSVDDLINRAMVARVEPALEKLGRPVFIMDFPAPMAALARLKPDDPTSAERFELYAGGLELCNGYGELTDPKEQRERFCEQLDTRQEMKKPTPPIDEAFLAALSDGMEDVSGNALGLDRLLMLLSGAESICDVLAFPLENELGWDDESWGR